MQIPPRWANTDHSCLRSGVTELGRKRTSCFGAEGREKRTFVRFVALTNKRNIIAVIDERCGALGQIDVGSEHGLLFGWGKGRSGVHHDRFQTAGSGVHRRDEIRQRGGSGPIHVRWSAIRSSEGEEIYSHKNAVLGAGFDALSDGDEVRYVVHEGECDKGPQASAVVAIGKHHLVP
jgi:cold shock CspA family protein